MIDTLLYVVWNPDLTAFQIGPFSIRWYSLCWLIGLLVAYLIVRWLYRDQRVPDEKFDPLFIYCFIGILIGARLGHCIFYQPEVFLTSWKGFIEMFLPIHFVNGDTQYASNWLFKMTNGSVALTGYAGLASHGGTLGLILALLLYCRRLKMPVWQVLDNIAIATGTTACFIRLGNLMNSEIIGRATDVPWAFVFERVDQLPRHPGQLYEAIAYAVYFLLCIVLYKKYPQRVGTGFYFGFCLFFIFTFRFFIEYTKEVQEAFEQSLPLDMGQLLSLPFIAVGLYFMSKGWKKTV